MSEMFKGDPDYEKIKAELEPFITRIAKIKGKATPEYQKFKKNVHEWNKRFFKANTNCRNSGIHTETANSAMAGAKNHS